MHLTSQQKYQLDEAETIEMNSSHDESDLQQQQNNSDNGYLNVEIRPTTGGNFHLKINQLMTVDELKRIICRKLSLAKDKICLLYKDRDLRDGKLIDNQVVDGSKVTLLPIVETGLMSQKPDQSVLQALESLSDVQVNTFLAGKAPLNLSMRVGEHMMFIQLQLSTVGNRKLNKKQSRSESNSEVRASQRQRVTGGDSQSPMQEGRTLVEASRNLSQTLKHFSTQTQSATADIRESTTASTKDARGGATIESMHHHGRGVYSGTFSGTLNPALQDSNGNPKRDISTVVHILNDLLGAGASSISSSNNSRRHRPPQPLKSSSSAQLKTEESSSMEPSRETTRGKMEQLQQLLLERRERRRARREAKASPYTSSVIPSSSSSLNSSNWLSNSGSPIVMHQPAPSDNKAADTADYIQLNSEPVAI